MNEPLINLRSLAVAIVAGEQVDPARKYAVLEAAGKPNDHLVKLCDMLRERKQSADVLAKSFDEADASREKMADVERQLAELTERKGTPSGEQLETLRQQGHALIENLIAFRDAIVSARIQLVTSADTSRGVDPFDWRNVENF